MKYAINVLESNRKILVKKLDLYKKLSIVHSFNIQNLRYVSDVRIQADEEMKNLVKCNKTIKEIKRLIQSLEIAKEIIRQAMGDSVDLPGEK